MEQLETIKHRKLETNTLLLKFTGKLKHSLSQQIQMYYGSGTVAHAASQ